jgi:hypothetical protein
VAAGLAPNYYLEPAAAAQPLQFGDTVGILAGSADPEGEVAMHAVAGAADLVGQGFGRGGQRVGVGHLEDGGDAAENGGARAGLQVFLVLGAGLAEVDLGVDDAGRRPVQSMISEAFGGVVEKSPRAAILPLRKAMSRRPTPSWLTTVPPFRMRS